jgi:hypothetical protein
MIKAMSGDMAEVDGGRNSAGYLFLNGETGSIYTRRVVRFTIGSRADEFDNELTERYLTG